MKLKTKLAYLASAGWIDEMAAMSFYEQGFEQALLLAASYVALNTNLNPHKIMTLGDEETGQDIKAVQREAAIERKKPKDGDNAEILKEFNRLME